MPVTSPPRTRSASEDVPLDLLLEGLYLAYGYDFRGYVRSSVSRRVLQRVRQEGVESVTGLRDKALRDRACAERLIADLAIGVTSMFRDPGFFTALRTKVAPRLRTYPFIRVWDAGCSTGEEAYSLAILLHEEGLFERARIYATDISTSALEQADAGVFPIHRMRDYTENYLKAGGRRTFIEYYAARNEAVRFKPWLRKNIIFSQHNLASDGSFNEFHLIVCRNVVIYFGDPLQDRARGILHDSLCLFGVLALGEKESLQFTRLESFYDEIDPKARLYRRIA
jgi:chemotaxis protein methyltransferase CheR